MLNKKIEIKYLSAIKYSRDYTEYTYTIKYYACGPYIIKSTIEALNDFILSWQSNGYTVEMLNVRPEPKQYYG